MKKILLFCVFALFSIFVNIDGVSAANSCTCYYTGYLKTKDNGSTYQTNYLVSIKFNKKDFDAVENKEDYAPTISYFGEKGYNTVTSESGKLEDKTSNASWYDYKFVGLVQDGQPKAGLDGDKVNSLFKNSCSCSALGKLTFWSRGDSKDLYYNIDDYYYDFSKLPFVGGLFDGDHERVDLTLITKSQFDEQRKSKNVAETAEDQGFSSNVDTNKIVEWAGEEGWTIDSIGNPCTVINDDLKKLLNTIFWIISILGIILVVVMTALSFIKAIVGSDDEKFRDAFRHLLTRIIVVIILLLLPMILSFIITLINDNVEGEVKIGSDGDLFCDIVS